MSYTRNLTWVLRSKFDQVCFVAKDIKLIKMDLKYQKICEAIVA